MADNHKHYDYYLVEGADVKTLIDGYDSIRKGRSDIITGIMGEFGAVAYTDTSGFGNKGSLLRGLVWNADYKFPCAVTIKRSDYLDGKKVISARGKGNTKDGREFNKLLDGSIKQANQNLGSLPSWQAYIIDHYNIMRTGFGEASGNFGMAMLTTYGGRCPGRDDCLLFAIPNAKDRDGYAKHGEVEIPPNFQKLTYGRFHDLANNQAA